MNLWMCDAPDCTVFASGVGGAIGLRAIGWYFRSGPVLYCPLHHPDTTDSASLAAIVAQDALAHAEGAVMTQDEIAAEIRRAYPNAVGVWFRVRANGFEVQIDTCERRGPQADYNIKLNGQPIEDLQP